MGSPGGWVGGASSLPSSAAFYGTGHSCSSKGHMLLRHAVPPHTPPRTTHLENTGIRELTLQLPSQGPLGQEYRVFTWSDIADVRRKS